MEMTQDKDKDYYYSAKHEKHLKTVYESYHDVYEDCFVNGVKYTEMIDKGKTPLTHEFDDIVKLEF